MKKLIKKLRGRPRALQIVYYYDAALTAGSKRDYSSALRKLARLEKIAPKYPYAILLKSSMSLRTGKYEDAIKCALTFKKLIRELKAPSENDKMYLRAYAAGCAFKAAKELGLKNLGELQFELEEYCLDDVDPILKRNFPINPKK